MESFLEAWDLICDYCKKQVTDVSYETWFSKLVPISLDFGAGVAIIQAPNEFNKSTIERGFHKCLNDAVQSVFGEAFTYKLITPMEKKKKSAYRMMTNTSTHLKRSSRAAPINLPAQPAAMLQKEPAKNYNPRLYLRQLRPRQNAPAQRHRSRAQKRISRITDIIYVKGDQFANELIEAIRAGTTVSFREKYRKADALLIDDIQFIAGKESTQEEFFHTFNTLYESKKQIVLTSDRPPRDIATLEDRLKTRFEWGLTADVQPPDFETRMAIIKRKAELVGLSVPDNVCEFIAQKLKSNIRQLEGTVKKLNAIHLVEGATPTISTAQRAISDIVNNEQPAPVTVSKIIEEVGRTYGVSPEDIKSSKRNANVSFARQISMYVVREITQMPMVEIGKEFGGRDHSTVVYAIQQIEEKSARDPVTKATVSDIIKNIRDR